VLATAFTDTSGRWSLLLLLSPSAVIVMDQDPELTGQIGSGSGALSVSVSFFRIWIIPDRYLPFLQDNLNSFGVDLRDIQRQVKRNEDVMPNLH
jgi:hypothetical protein